MHILGVPKATFYRYQIYWKNNQKVRDHGNSRLLKPRHHTEQVVAILKYILNKKADHIPHQT